MGRAGEGGFMRLLSSCSRPPPMTSLNALLRSIVPLFQMCYQLTEAEKVPQCVPWESSAGLSGPHSPPLCFVYPACCEGTHPSALPQRLSQRSFPWKSTQDSATNVLMSIYPWLMLIKGFEHSLYVMQRKEEADLHKQEKKGARSQVP